MRIWLKCTVLAVLATAAACGNDATQATSEDVARRMAEGALARAHPSAHLSVAVTGVAGPGPSGPTPAGRVHVASARRGAETLHQRFDFGDVGRGAVRRATVIAALDLLLQQLG